MRQEHDKRLRLMTLLDRRIEYADSLPSEEFETGDMEYTCAGQNARALFVAMSLDGLAVSLRSTDVWDVPNVFVEKTWVDGDELRTVLLTVPHGARPAHLDQHRDWLLRTQPPLPSNGKELWKEKATLFQSLDFCSSVQHQVESLSGNEPRFRAVMRGFADLQNYCDTWDTDNFDIHRLANASGESQSTLQLYSGERTFVCPDGASRVFKWHLKRGDTRIHFVDFPATKRILVGYAGNHLPISSQ